MLLSGVIEDVVLQNRHVDAVQQIEIGNVLQRALADHRQDPPGGAVVDDVGQILGDPHRDPGSTAGLELDHAAVDGDRR